MKDSTYIDLLNRFIKGNTSPKEETRLREWFYSDASSDEIETFYREKWESEKTKGMPDEQQLRILNSIKSEITGENVPARKRSAIHRWLPYAASALLCLSIGAASYLYVKEKTTTDVREYTILADKGQRSTILLPDGSKVWLNSHTKISYSNDYGKAQRNVSLTGEAYFEVAKDSNCPFIVNAGEMEVKVLGTTFNIRAYAEDKEIVATLFSGKIEASIGNTSVILRPDQYASFNRDERRLTAHASNNPSYAKMWRDNELAFKSQTFGEIAIILNRIYNVHLEFKSEKIKQYRFSGVIKNNSLDNVIEIISLTAPIVYESKGDTIILSEKK
ncbi:MAG: FecR domain-containing protein [Tannerellaceae bacterium]|jgi:ferric-dicitrate binding protein FerR (iron transport regulator)|nr:FecR domain-containing protein [Tannerellaceae bacterium]